MNKKALTVIFALVLIISLTMVIVNVTAAPGINKTGESTVTTSALSLVLSDYYLNGLSFQQDAITTYNGWQYAAFYNSSRQVNVARRQLPSGSWQVLALTDYTQSTNDAHNIISIGIAPNNGTIHLAFDHHDSTLHYRKSVNGLATNPGSYSWTASQFGAVTSQLVSGVTVTQVTYPRFVATPQGDLQFECRIGTSGSGQNYLWEYQCSTGNWTSLGMFVNNPNGGNAYLNGFHYAKNGRLHVSWVKRNTPDASTNHDLHYIYSNDNGRTWMNNGGTLIGTTGSDPVTIEEPKFLTISTNSGLINQESQTIDNQGRVHLLMRKTVNGTNYQFHYWRGTDGVWHETNTQMKTKYWARRGKIAVDANNNVYAIMPDLIIGSASASSNWTDWAVVNNADENKYHSEPLYDWQRLYNGDGILSVIYQQKAIGTLIVLDYQLNTTATPVPTPSPAVTASPLVTMTPTSGRTATPIVTATPVPTTGSIKVQFYNQSTAATSNQIYFNIKLVNTGTGSITLSNVKMRYYYTIDGVKPQTFYCDYSPAGSGNVTGTFVTMATAKTGADTYVEIGFTNGAGSLAGGGNVLVQGRFAKNDWSNYTQTNDYSFNSSATTYLDWTKTTGYVSGALQWGVEP